MSRNLEEYPASYPDELPHGFRICLNTILSHLRQYAIDSVHNHVIESKYKVDACNQLLSSCISCLPQEHRESYREWLGKVRGDVAESACLDFSGGFSEKTSD